MYSPARSALSILSITAIVGLTACGGSGTAGSGGGSQVMAAPPLASPVYSGVTSAAATNETNAAVLGVETQLAVDLTASLPERLTNTFDNYNSSNQPFTRMVKNPAYPLSSESLNGDGTGWVETNFNNYHIAEDSTFNYGERLEEVTPDNNPAHGEYEYSGTVVYQFVTKSNAPRHAILSFTNLRIISGHLDLTVNGSIDADLDEPAAYYGGQTTVANVSIRDNANGHTWRVTNFAVSSLLDLNNKPVKSHVTVTGALADSEYGSVTVSTPGQPLLYEGNVYNLGPAAGSYLQMQGKEGRSVYFGSINYYLSSVAVDAAGIGAPAESRRYDWATGRPDVPTSFMAKQLTAVARLQKGVSTTSPGILDGRLSFSPAGKYVSFQWSVDLRQPDSNPRFDDSRSAMPVFTSDKSGDYLVKLTVSDGIGTSIDRILVTVDDVDGDQTISPQWKSGPSNLLSTVGQALTFDGHEDAAFVYDTPGSYQENWQLTVPSGSNATLDDPQAVTPSFTPDIDGYYVLVHNQAPAMIINIGEPFQYSAPIQMLPTNLSNYIPVDFDRDGKLDIVYSSSRNVVILKNKGGGNFETIQNYTFGLVTGSPIAVADINGDGLQDLLVDVGGSVKVVTQKPDGSFDNSGSIHPHCGVISALGLYPLRTEKIAGDSVFSVLYQGDCADGIHVYRNDGSGNFTQSAVVPNIDTNWQVGDVTGDGMADVIVTQYSAFDPTNSMMLVYPGKADGTFDTPASYSLGTRVNANFTGGGVGPFLITDMNGDNLLDITTITPSNILGVSNYFSLYEQQSGVLATAVTVPAATSNLSGNYTAADINGDGLNDLIFLAPTGIGIDLQDSSHSFSTQLIYPADIRPPVGFSALHGMYVVDINGDGVLDIVLPDGHVMLGATPGQ